jgi:hypothetical protein
MKDNDDEPDMLDEYSEEHFRLGVRGKYLERYNNAANIVVLDPDVLEYFPDSESVNRALRALADIIRDQQTRVPA